MNAYAATNVGLIRSVNQDYVYYSLEPVGCLANLFIVADGMGGHKAGDVASRCSVERFVKYLKQTYDKDEVTAINSSITKVNEEIITMANENPDYAGMGTTFVAATIDDNMLKVANIGDSRLYIAGEDIIQITRDHSLVEELIYKGEIDREQARTHEKKNFITRAIGGRNSVEAEMFCVELKPNDKIVMCSDGLSNMVEDKDILKIINESSDIRDAVENLIEEANRNGGTDNISVMIIEP